MKKYNSVVAMIKDIDPEMAKELAKTLKAKTFYVYVNNDDDDVEVFSELKFAKKFAEERVGEVEWDGGKDHWHDNGYVHIYKKKVIDHMARVRQ